MVCEFCQGSRFPGIHFPAYFDDREDSRDGKVFIASCDECYPLGSGIDSDMAAAERIRAVTGWEIRISYDADDAVTKEARDAGQGKPWFRPYFAVSFVEACFLMG